MCRVFIFLYQFGNCKNNAAGHNDGRLSFKQYLYKDICAAHLRCEGLKGCPTNPDNMHRHVSANHESSRGATEGVSACLYTISWYLECTFRGMAVFIFHIRRSYLIRDPLLRRPIFGQQTLHIWVQITNFSNDVPNNSGYEEHPHWIWLHLRQEVELEREPMNVELELKF